VADDDQIDAQIPRHRRDVLDRPAERQMTGRGKPAGAQPLDALLEHFPDGLLLVVQHHRRGHINHGGANQRRRYGQKMGFGAEFLREFGAFDQRPAPLSRRIVTQQNFGEGGHRRSPSPICCQASANLANLPVARLISPRPPGGRGWRRRPPAETR
jgi:hypothetical protein